MKRIAAVLLAALLLMSGIGLAAAEEEITLDVIICRYGPNTSAWFSRGQTGMNGTNFVEKFEAVHPGIRLNLEIVAWNDVYRVVADRIAAGNPPDILNSDVFANYAAEDLLLPVSDYCPDALYNDFIPAFLDQSVVEGTVWAVPDLASARALYYNVDMFAEVGIDVPKTWAELEEACQAIIDFYGGEVYPWGVDMTTDEGQAAFSYYTWNNGGGFVDAEGSWALNSDMNVEAIEFAIGLVKKGYTNPDPAGQDRYELQDLFGSGKLAMLIAPNSLPTYLADKGYAGIELATAPIPHNEGCTSASQGVVDRIMAFRDDSLSSEQSAARNDAIGKFLTFFYDEKHYVSWVSMEGFLPAVNSAVASLVEMDDAFSGWLDVLSGCLFYPTAKAEWDQVKNGVISVEQSALQGGDVEALLEALQNKLTR